MQGKSTDYSLFLKRMGKKGYFFDENSGRTPWHFAADANDIESITEMMKNEELMKYIDTIDREGRTLLQFACANGYDEVASLCFATGANVKTTNNNGENALLLACKGNHEKLFHLCFEKGIQADTITIQTIRDDFRVSHGGEIEDPPSDERSQDSFTYPVQYTDWKRSR